MESIGVQNTQVQTQFCPLLPCDLGQLRESLRNQLRNSLRTSVFSSATAVEALEEDGDTAWSPRPHVVENKIRGPGIS